MIPIRHAGPGVLAVAAGIVSLILVALTGCADAPSSDAALLDGAARRDPDAGRCNPTTAELGLSFDAGATATGCNLRFDAHVGPSGDASAAGDCGASPSHCDPGPVATWCACGARMVQDVVSDHCGNQACWSHLAKLCAKGCVTLPSGEGRCLEDLPSRCTSIPPGRLRATVFVDGAQVSGSFAFAGYASSVSDRSVTIARTVAGAVAASQLRIVLYSPVRWRWGLAAGMWVKVAGTIGGDGCGHLAIRDAAGKLLFGLFRRSQLPGKDELGFEIRGSTEPACPGEPLCEVTGVDGVAAVIPVGQSAKVATSWGDLDVWNLAIAGGDRGSEILVAHACAP